jgi:peptidoglycan-N-acetylglucosamine deacetylase
MSVDLEDFYCDLPFSKWDAYEGRVAKITRIILDKFEKYKVRATFFVLGYIAEKNPELIEEVKTRGHEIASHGYSHIKVTKMTKQNFELDLAKSLAVLRKISGEKILLRNI